MTLLKQDSPKEILGAFCDEIFPSNTTAILHINNPLSIRRRTAASQYVTELSVYFGIPLISWDADDSGGSQNRVESRILQIAPTIHHQTQAIFTLLQRYNWTLISIVTSTTAGHIDFISELRALSKNSLKVKSSTYGHQQIRIEVISNIILRNITNKSQTMKELTGLIETESRVILLHSNSLQSKYIMDYAHELGIAGSEYVWILSQSAIPTAKYAPRSFHLGLLGVSYDHGKVAMENAIKMAATTWVTALNNIAKKRNLISSISPNLTCEGNSHMFWKNGSIFYDYLRNVTVTGPPNIQFNETGILLSTELKIMNIQRRGTGKMWEQVGSWNKQGLLMKDITWPGEAAGPPRGKPARKFVRVVTLQENPYVIYLPSDPITGGCNPTAVPCRVYERDENKNRLSNITIPKCCIGLSIDLLKILSNELDFDYELFEVEDGQWGAENQDTKEWNGLPRALVDKKADWVVTSLKINPERASVVDFSAPYLETGITIIVAIREGAISATAFLEPYDYPSWTLILVFSVHATGASIFIFEWLSPYGLNQGKTTLREHKFSLFRSFWLIWAMLFSAAVSTDTPRGVSSRFLANMWALFALVFLASYTANLAAFMITKEEYYDLSGIQDLRLKNPYVTKPPFKYATIPSGSTESNIKKNHPDMYNYMKKYNVPTVADGVAALKKQEIQAFIYDATVLEYLAGQDKHCRLITVGSWYAMTGYGVAFPHGSQWKDKVNKIILEQQDKGELERLQKFWLAGACQKKKKRKGISSHTLGILNFTSAFILLACGMVLGAILLGIEHCYFRFGRSKLKKWDKCGCCALVSLSMGKSLTFEQSVLEAIQTHRKRRCKDALCETQLWKIKHELDLALLKIDKLEDRRKQNKIEGGNSVWRYNPVGYRQPNGIPRRKSIEKSCIREEDVGSSERLLFKDQEDTRSEGNITPRRRAVLRRSPSYTNAISISECDDLDEAQKNKKRYHEGKFYVEVNNDPETESMF
ncbi:hypothetical protein SNE40_018908 [Patella caerulea]|uniref:Uncharacterized protein n=1 Tax=Patella caerulea TaxID=87958 RepID=A0AAN8P8R1_PATCE